jgi:hypothetical protein
MTDKSGTAWPPADCGEYAAKRAEVVVERT